MNVIRAANPIGTNDARPPTLRHPPPVCGPEFTLPLDAGSFTAALHQGLGRAVLHADRFGLRGHEVEIEACCLQDPSYDPQCEMREPGWWLDLAEKADIIPRLLDQLVTPIPKSELAFWDRNWRVKVAAELARRGQPRGVDIVLSLCGPSERGNDVVGDAEVIELVGAEGLLTLADRIGCHWGSEPGRCDVDFVRQFDERFGQGEARRILLASNLDGVKRFVKDFLAIESADVGIVRVDRVKFDPTYERPQPLSAEEFLAVFEELPVPKPQYFSNRHRLRRTEQDRAVVFNRLLVEQESSRTLALARAFQRDGFPRFDEPVLSWLTHSDATIRHVTWMASKTLAHPAIRRAIDTAFASRSFEPCVVNALQSNWRVSDAAMLIEALRHRPDDHDRHSIGFAITKIAPHMADDLSLVLNWVYATTACVNCRLGAAEGLVRTDAVGPELRHELQRDCTAEIRALATVSP